MIELRKALTVTTNTLYIARWNKWTGATAVHDWTPGCDKLETSIEKRVVSSLPEADEFFTQCEEDAAQRDTKFLAGF
jgi:hypothetical protein